MRATARSGGELGRKGESKGSWGNQERESKKKKGGFRKNWGVDMGAEVTLLSVGIVFSAEVLMHVLLQLPKMSESDGARCD